MADEARLVVRAGRVTGVDVGGTTIAGDVIVLAAGAWTADVLAPIGVRVAVTPERGQIIHLRLPGVDTSRWPVVLPDESKHYLLTFDDSRVVVGATREPEAGFEAAVTAAGMAEVLDHALAVAPGLATAIHLETRVGLRPTGPDRRPLLGPIPAVPGLIVATGLGADGLTMGPYVGGLVADLALGRPSSMDLAQFNPIRPSHAQTSPVDTGS